MAKMNNIFADAEEKFVKTVVLYGHTDNYIYIDEAHTTKVGKDTLLNLCLKGITIKYNDVYYKPVYFSDEETYVSVTIATVVNAASTAAVTLNSSEYTAD